MTPAAGGIVQTGDAVGFRPDTTVHCMLRASDLAGALTPLGNSVDVVVPALNSLQVITDQGSQLGYDVTGVGDVNGDGVDDVLTGGNGEAYLYFGWGKNNPAPTGPVAPSVTIHGTTAAAFGNSIAALGDFNGDMRPDFAVGAGLFGTGNKGAVYMFYGRAQSDPWPSVIDVTSGACPADLCLFGEDGLSSGAGDIDTTGLFGYSIAGAGDFNGDGKTDLLVGALGQAGFIGRIYVIFGSGFASGTSKNIPQDAASVDGVFVQGVSGTDYQLGFAVAGLGPAIGGDALSEVAYTSTGTTGVQGSLYVLEGRTNTPGSGLVQVNVATELANGSLRAEEHAGPNGSYGTTLANVGDLNNDGRPEVAIRHLNVEKAIVFKGSSTGYDPSSLFQVLNDSSAPGGDAFGYDYALGTIPGFRSWGDIDGDGYGDLFVGSQQDPTAPGDGQLYFGESPLPATRNRSTADLTFDPATTGGQIRYVGYIGDINGDGAPDLAVGDPSNKNGSSVAVGQVLLYY